MSSVGFGAWAIGGSWGDVSHEDAKATLHAALDSGVTFVDTADVYGDGRSERIIAEVLAERDGPRPFVATKAGRRIDPHVAEGYTAEALEGFIDRKEVAAEEGGEPELAHRGIAGGLITGPVDEEQVYGRIDQEGEHGHQLHT